MNNDKNVLIGEEGNPEDFDEETSALLELAKAHTFAKRLVASKAEIDKRSTKKKIANHEARKELLNESRAERKRLVDEAGKILKPRLNKETKRKLGFRTAGRPQGSKNKSIVLSRTSFYKKLRQLAKSKNELGEVLTELEAAKALGLGSTRQLRRKLKEYGEEKNWKGLIADLLG